MMLCKHLGVRVVVLHRVVPHVDNCACKQRLIPLISKIEAVAGLKDALLYDMGVE